MESDEVDRGDGMNGEGASGDTDSAEGRRDIDAGLLGSANRPEVLSSASGADQMLHNTLLNGDFACLITSGPLASTDPVPSSQCEPIIDMPPALPNFAPKTTMEKKLVSLLQECEGCKAALQACLHQAQASNILNQLYCNRLRSQLAFVEEKKKKGKVKGQLMGDGLPAFLSGDDW